MASRSNDWSSVDSHREIRRYAERTTDRSRSARKLADLDASLGSVMRYVSKPPMTRLPLMLTHARQPGV